MGKTILITGGSDGLGKAICEKLSKENRVIHCFALNSSTQLKIVSLLSQQTRKK